MNKITEYETKPSANVDPKPGAILDADSLQKGNTTPDYDGIHAPAAKPKGPITLDATDTDALRDLFAWVEIAAPNGLPMPKEHRDGRLIMKRLEGLRNRVTPPVPE